jgi:adenine-specific DNA methylase
MKLLYKAPLPFLGQKRNWIRYLPELLQGNLFDKGFSDYKNGIFVDMFGGSGLLSHNI